jgi:hypothetical protein
MTFGTVLNTFCQGFVFLITGTSIEVWFWAEANGEEVQLPNGEVFAPPPGSLIRISELYFTEAIGTNIGTKASAKKIAEEIRKHEALLKEQKWISCEVNPGPADNQIRNVTESDTETIEKKMADAGIRWESSDKSRGSRKIGFQLARDMLEAVLEQNGNPGLYFMDNCVSALDIIPTLPRDPDDMDDIDTTAEDHPWDETRYRILKGSNRYATSFKVQFPT